MVRSILLAAVAWLAAPLAAADLNAALNAVARYESGADATPLRAIERAVAEAAGNSALRKELEAGLAELLGGDATFEGKRFACQQLAIVGGKASVPALAALLKTDDTVGIACLALASNPAREAGAALRQAVGSLNGRARAQVIHALGVRADPQAVATLTALVRDPDTDVAEAAISALGKIATPAAVKAIAALRADARSPQMLAVTEASLHLAERLAANGKRAGAIAIYEELLRPVPQAEPPVMRDPAGLPPHYPLHVRRAALSGLLRLDRDGGEKRMLEVLRGDEAALKPVAIAAVAGLKAPGAAVKFARELPKLQPAEQSLLIAALAHRGEAAALPEIRKLVHSPDAGTRAAAVEAEGTLGDARSVPVLARALASAQTPAETQSIVNALARLKGGAAVDEALIAQLNNRMAGPKTPLITALGRRGSQAAVPALLASAASPDAAAAKAAFQALGRIATGRELPHMLDALASLKAADVREDAETAVAQVISNMPDVAQRSEAVAARLAKATAVEARCSLIRLLSTAGGEPAFQALKPALSDPNAEVREAAVRALAEWPHLTAWDQLAAVHAKADNASLRAVAMRGLCRLAAEGNARLDERQIARYRELLAAANNDSERKLVLGALAGANHPEALKLALEQLNQAGVRAEAVLAVKKIAEAIKEKHPEAAAAALKAIK